MTFRQDRDPGSVKSLLALLRSNQDHGHSTASSPTPPPAATSRPVDAYSLASNPFHQQTHGYSGHSASASISTNGNPGQSSGVPAASSLQDLLATLRQSNSDPSSSRPYTGESSASRFQQPHEEVRDRPPYNPQRSWDDHETEPTQAPSSKRRRVEREVDPYAEDVPAYDPVEDDHLDMEDHPPEAQTKSQPEPEVESETGQTGVIDLSTDDDGEEEHDGMKRYGYTTEQMADLSIEEGRPILDELLQRGDVLDKLKKLKKEQEELERHMWKKREEIVADYKKKLPADRPPDHPEYKKIIEQRSSALTKFYAQRVLPFYDITLKKQLVALVEIGFPCLGDPGRGDPEVGEEIRKRRRAVQEVVAKAVGVGNGKG